MQNNDRRFIEEYFPIEKVSENSAREKNIRHGHISTLHIWWARRPLASSRTTAYAALIPAPKDNEEKSLIEDRIIELSEWKNSLDKFLINQVREDILKANNGIPPRVLDPFSGGGSIPLEGLRLGCKVYATEYNPVAVLILKCTLEYPQKYGKPIKKKVKGELGLEEEVEENPLLESVKKWGEWVLEEAKKEIGKFYPPDEDGSIPVGFIWARTIPCQNPSCGAEIPLMRQFWLAKKDKRKIALYPYVEKGSVKFRIVGDGYDDIPKGFDPSKGTVSRAIAVCPVCGSTVDDKTTRRLFREGKASQRMVAVVLHKPRTHGKRYRIATEKDLEIFKQAEKYLEEKREQLREAWGIDPVPDEEILRKCHEVDRMPMYGMNTWGDLFNSRQKLALITFIDKIKAAYKEIQKECSDPEFAKAVVSYLGLGVNRLADKSSSLCRIIPQTEAIGFTYGRQALPMLWDYIEMNPLEHPSGWRAIADETVENLSHFSRIPQMEYQEEAK